MAVVVVVAVVVLHPEPAHNKTNTATFALCKD